MPSKTTSLTRSGTTANFKTYTHARGSSTSSTGKLKRDPDNHVVVLRNGHGVGAGAGGTGGRKGKSSVAKVDAVQQGGVDDDEWVSSESGVVTPATVDYDADGGGALAQMQSQTKKHFNPETDLDHEAAQSTTPRGEHPPQLLPSPEHPPPQPHSQHRTRRPRPQSMADLPRVDTTTTKHVHTYSSPVHSPDSLYHPSPSLASPQRRPHSARGVRPHPLIRALSYIPGPNTAPANGDSMSPTSPSERHPPMLRRHPSTSSVASVATLPLSLPSTATATATTTRVHGERQRQHLSTPASATVAALSSLAAAATQQPHHYVPSRPPSPLYAVTFPPVPPNGRGGAGAAAGTHGLTHGVHGMIPVPLVPPHASATAHQNPFWESLVRVREAKARAGW